MACKGWTHLYASDSRASGTWLSDSGTRPAIAYKSRLLAGHNDWVRLNIHNVNTLRTQSTRYVGFIGTFTRAHTHTSHVFAVMLFMVMSILRPSCHAIYGLPQLVQSNFVSTSGACG